MSFGRIEPSSNRMEKNMRSVRAANTYYRVWREMMRLKWNVSVQSKDGTDE